jgi:hypothetical protein
VFPPVFLAPRIFAENWRPNDCMTMEKLISHLRNTHRVPRTKIEVVTALLGSTSPMPTLIPLMPEVYHVGSAVYVQKCAVPGLLNNRHSNEHVYLSLPEGSTAPFCLRHAGFCHHTIDPHVLICDHGALDAKFPNIVTRLFGMCSAFALLSVAIGNLRSLSNLVYIVLLPVPALRSPLVVHISGRLCAIRHAENRSDLASGRQGCF